MNGDLPKAVSRATTEHYQWGAGCDGYFLLKRPEAHVIEERMPPGAAEKAHQHERARQLFYVLEGELTMQFEDDDIRVRMGEALEVAPGVVHQAKNKSEMDVRFVLVSVPPSHGDRVDVE